MEQYKTGLLNETIRVPTGDDERISLATLPDGSDRPVEQEVVMKAGDMLYIPVRAHPFRSSDDAMSM